MKNHNADSIFIPHCKFFEIWPNNKNSENGSFFNPELSYKRSGVLIWHCLENRLFLSESFGRMLGIPECRLTGIKQFPLSGQMDNLKSFVDRLTMSLFACRPDNIVFKAPIPGTNKIIHGYAELCEKEEIGILDVIIFCFVEEVRDDKSE